MRNIFSRNFFIIISTVVVMLITVRLLLPSVLLKELNIYLATFSTVYRFHLTDVKFCLYRGAYYLQGVEGQLKNNHQNFLTIKEVKVSFAWREIFTGRPKIDLLARGLNFRYLENHNENDFESFITEARSLKIKIFPLNIARLDLLESSLFIDEYPEKPLLSHLEGRMTNLERDKKNHHSSFSLKTNLLDSAVVTSQGKINFNVTPIQWDLDSELLNFDMTELNPLLVKKLPMTFTQGELDFYVEAISEHGKISGYVKPFIQDLDVKKKTQRIRGPKHWIYEILTVGSNLIAKASTSRMVSSKINFIYDQAFKVDTRKATSKLLQHPGIEHTLEIK